MNSARLAPFVVSGMIVIATPASAHMTEKCAEALTTYSLVAAARISTTTPGETLRVDKAPETVIAALHRVIQTCVSTNRQRPRSSDQK